jgi:hypothetical protein
MVFEGQRDRSHASGDMHCPGVGDGPLRLNQQSRDILYAGAPRSRPSPVARTSSLVTAPAGTRSRLRPPSGTAPGRGSAPPGDVHDPHPVANLPAEARPLPGGARRSSSPWATRRGAVPPAHQSAKGVIWLTASVRSPEAQSGDDCTCASRRGSDAGDRYAACRSASRSASLRVSCRRR